MTNKDKIQILIEKEIESYKVPSDYIYQGQEHGVTLYHFTTKTKDGYKHLTFTKNQMDEHFTIKGE